MRSARRWSGQRKAPHSAMTRVKGSRGRVADCRRRSGLSRWRPGGCCGVCGTVGACKTTFGQSARGELWCRYARMDCIVFEMIAGQRLFQARNAKDQIRDIVALCRVDDLSWVSSDTGVAFINSECTVRGAGVQHHQLLSDVDRSI